MSSPPSAQFFPYSLPQKGSILVERGADKFFVVGRACELSAFSYAPIFLRPTGEDRSLYGRAREPPRMQFYDKVHREKQREGFRADLHRCDRIHAKSKGLEVAAEEAARPIPVLWNSQYGHVRTPPEVVERPRAKRNTMIHEFLRKNGVTIAVDEEPKRMAGRGP